ncbi:MAG: hypothetical protein WCE75_06595 [Terracidiphilus sp.]
MRLGSCPQEKEVAALVRNGGWPEAVQPELRAHLDGCRACAELARLSEALRRLRTASVAEAQLPAPGVLWWRAQLRCRHAALASIRKPLVGAQVFALATLLVGAAAFLASTAESGSGWTGRLAALAGAFHFEAFWSVPGDRLSPEWGLLIVALAAFALLGGVVVYLTGEKR